MKTAPLIKIIVNNQTFSLEKKTSLNTFLINNKYHPEKILTSINGHVVNSKDYRKIILKSNDQLELLAFVPGG